MCAQFIENVVRGILLECLNRVAGVESKLSF